MGESSPWGYPYSEGHQPLSSDNFKKVNPRGKPKEKFRNAEKPMPAFHTG
jgi:hypothetical protein